MSNLGTKIEFELNSKVNRTINPFSPALCSYLLRTSSLLTVKCLASKISECALGRKARSM